MWDTAGPDDYDHLRPLNYPGTCIIPICFAIDSPDSLDNVQEKWVSEVRYFCPGIPIVLVGYKSDLRHEPEVIEELRKTSQRPVSKEKAMVVAEKIGAKIYLECSARKGLGVREIFHFATRAALLVNGEPPKQTGGLKGLLSLSKYKSQRKAEDAKLATAISAEKAEQDIVKYLADSSAPRSLRLFRILIIGKTGCGKTTILSKVCGGNMVDAPSTARGVHDIEREIKFDRNDKMVAHDSEGFEAGHKNEVDVVKAFIEKRSMVDDINLKLHLVWYCIEMNARPIQHAEQEFFSKALQVPVVAIITNFDSFVQDIQQKMEEDADAEGREVDDDELEKEANKEATDKFEKHYKNALQCLPHPPRAVVALSGAHNSTPDNTRLAQLIQETMNVLKPQDPEPLKKERNVYDLSTFFAIAQNADTRTKLSTSTTNGMFWNHDRPTVPLFRGGPFIDTWGTAWTAAPEGLARTVLRAKLAHELETVLDHSWRIIGHRGYPDFAEIREDNTNLPPYCRWEQLVADTTLVMEKIYIHDIQDKDKLKSLLVWYDEHSKTARYVRDEIMKLYRMRKRTGFEVPSGFTTEAVQPLVDIVCSRPLEAWPQEI
ncbi:ras-domain-containing protein [Athelia psychrophila]|uniref:Ras-domain-containing protein n=1 Tax=Athelia psychrophila TaxID=1759441 RepID=A0A165YHP4_9AGAM|nr:ras-domain-containing protein [Fibularhizoctonia sp. CBS 109695]